AFTVEDDGVVVEEFQTDDPLSAIEAFSRRFNVPDIPGLPRFFGGLVGYFGYDTVRTVEKRLADSAPPDDLGTPDILLMVSTDVLVFDNMSSRVKFISLTDPTEP
ncbi:MAG: anthranilate synthase component I, partial [Gammaproteobacteria bacterium]|nr:anthranilate synthase component I [Gammaproteobacteria bacterium]